MTKPILTKLGMLRNGRGTTYTLLPIHCIAIPDAQTTVARNEQFPLSRLVSIPELQGVNGQSSRSATGRRVEMSEADSGVFSQWSVGEAGAE